MIPPLGLFCKSCDNGCQFGTARSVLYSTTYVPCVFAVNPNETAALAAFRLIPVMPNASGGNGNGSYRFGRPSPSESIFGLWRNARLNRRTGPFSVSGTSTPLFGPAQSETQ